MNGLAVMLCLTALGVQQSWRTTPAGELEYVLQVEPTFLASLEQGETVTSKLPSTATQVHRLCLRFSATDLKKAPHRTPKLPPLPSAEEQAAGNGPDIPVAIVVDAQGRSEETTDVSHGWQVEKDHRVQYLVQLSPDLLGKLREGDEIYMNIYPEAGQIQQFVVLSGQNVLPRKSEKDHRHSPLASNRNNTVAPVAAEDPAGIGPVARDNAATASRLIGSRAKEPRTSEPARLPASPRYAAADEPEPFAQQPEEQPIAEQSQYGSVADDGGNAPASELFVENSAEETTPEEPMEPAHGYNPARSTPPRAAANKAPNFDKSQFDHSQFASGDDNVAAAGAEEEPTGVEKNRTASREPLQGKTGLGKGMTKSPKRLPAATSDANEPKPWWPLFFTCCALFLSVGGNLYLGWTAAEFYRRYRLAMERMRSGDRESERD
jgi:hypothetical protein